jgi:hypothetical protein
MKKSIHVALVAGASTLAASASGGRFLHKSKAASRSRRGPQQRGDYQHKTKQNFDSLPNTPSNASLGSTPAGWVDDTTTPAAGQFSLPGWYLYHPIAISPKGGANGNARFRAGTGSTTTGAFWSFGPAGNADRALGILNSDNTSTPSNTVPAPATLEAQQMFAAIRSRTAATGR